MILSISGGSIQGTFIILDKDDLESRADSTFSLFLLRCVNC